jgi:signal transduction histidine kinase
MKTAPSLRTLDVTDQFSVALAKPGEFNAFDVLDGLHNDVFKPRLETIGPGDRSVVYWFRARLASDRLRSGPNYLYLPYPLLNKVELWWEEGGQLRHFQSGTHYPFKARAIAKAEMVFPLPDDLSTGADIAISVDTASILPFYAFLLGESDWRALQSANDVWNGLFYGALMILFLYNLFFGLALRDAGYLYYALGLIGMTGISLLVSGKLQTWELFPTNGLNIAILAAAWTVVSVLLFINRVLDLDRLYPRLVQFSSVINWLFIPAVLIEFSSLVYPPLSRFAVFIVLVLGNLGIAYFLLVSVLSWFRGVHQARYVTLSSSMFIFSFLFYQGFLFQQSTPSWWILHALEAGVLAQGLSMSLALADRINLLTRQKKLAEQKAAHYQRDLSRRLLRAEESERERFSSILHDSIANGVLVLQQNIKALITATQRDEMKQMLHSQSVYCGEMLAEIRNLSHDLHPHILSRLGLKEAMLATMERAFDLRGIEWMADIEEPKQKLEDDHQIALYRSFQECINNILKHADASEVVVRLYYTEQDLVLEVKDDGDGFDSAETGKMGLGLKTLSERLKLYGSSLNVDSSPGQGTFILIVMPLAVIL